MDRTEIIKSNSCLCLLAMLAEHPLDRDFEDVGNFIFQHDGMTQFFGNFFTYSHVFRISTNDAATIEQLTTAIRANQQRPDYLSQPVPVDTETLGRHWRTAA